MHQDWGAYIRSQTFTANFFIRPGFQPWFAMGMACLERCPQAGMRPRRWRSPRVGSSLYFPAPIACPGTGQPSGVQSSSRR
jgi:hypothetical protein